MIIMCLHHDVWKDGRSQLYVVRHAPNVKPLFYTNILWYRWYKVIYNFAISSLHSGQRSLLLKQHYVETGIWCDLPPTQILSATPLLEIKHCKYTKTFSLPAGKEARLWFSPEAFLICHWHHVSRHECTKTIWREMTHIMIYNLSQLVQSHLESLEEPHN